MGDKFNLKNPAVKRILQEVREMHANPSDDFMSSPLEENIFEWQFAIRGAVGTEFEGGIFHGRIQLPAEYPFQPPAFLLLTPNGRFETQTKICLSISNHHPEHWQPSWSVRTALLALIAFMPSSPNGALGSLDYKKEERQALAVKSRETSPKYGTPERQKLIDEIHEYMLSKASQLVHKIGRHIPKAEEMTGEEGSTVQICSEQVSNPVSGDDVVATRPKENPNLCVTGEVRQRPPDDRLFTWAAVGLAVTILVLIFRKLLKSSGQHVFFMDES